MERNIGGRAPQSTDRSTVSGFLPLELMANNGLNSCSFFVHRQDSVIGKRFEQPFFVSLALTRPADSISEFAQRNDGNRNLCCPAKNRL
jgi:hypothetical protein